MRYLDETEFFHGTSKEGYTNLVDKQTFSKDALQKRDGGFFGAGFYLANSFSHAKHYGPHVLKVTVKPAAQILIALEAGTHSSIVPTKDPSYFEEFKDYWVGIIAARKGLDYALKLMAECYTPSNPKEFDRLTYYRYVSTWAAQEGLDGVNWLSETILFKPSCVSKIEKVRK